MSPSLLLAQTPTFHAPLFHSRETFSLPLCLAAYVRYVMDHEMCVSSRDNVEKILVKLLLFNLPQTGKA